MMPKRVLEPDRPFPGIASDEEDIAQLWEVFRLTSASRLHDGLPFARHDLDEIINGREDALRGRLEAVAQAKAAVMAATFETLAEFIVLSGFSAPNVE